MLFEVDEAATRIREEADPDANIIVGASFDESLEGIVRVSVVATGIDNLDPARQFQLAQNSLTELAGRLSNDSSRIADRIERSAPLPQLKSPPLRPTARNPEGRAEYARNAAPPGLDPYGRTPPVRNSIEENVLDVPAFLRRRAN
jgi:cell division protein FtsZ